MNRRYKLNVLVAVCVASMIILSWVQFYLVRNTYKIVEIKYQEEIERDMMQIINSTEFVGLQEKRKQRTKIIINQYKNDNLTANAFFKLLTNEIKRDSAVTLSFLQNAINNYPILRGVYIKAQYEEIIVGAEQDSDTLLSQHESPILFIGSGFPTANSILLKSENTVNVVTGEAANKNACNYSFSQSYYLDDSVRIMNVLKRMIGVFLLSTGTIVAVSYFFYLLFRAFIRQKKLAEIQTDFANNITHELKTPLTSMRLILKSLKRAEIIENSEKTRELLQTLERQQDKLQRIVDDVLESVMDPGDEIKKTNLNITAHLHQYVNDLIFEDHPLKVEISPNEQIVLTNAACLNKVLNSLFENAAKYSQSGTPITLKAYRENKEYIIEVADCGPGIEEVYQDRVFDKFYRISEKNKHSVNGLGLGLYLAKQATEQIGGQLRLKSNPGIGSIFGLHIPV